MSGNEKWSLLGWARQSLVGRTIVLLLLLVIPMSLAVVGLFVFRRVPAYEWVLAFMIVDSLAGIITWLVLFRFLEMPSKKRNR